MKNGQSIDTGNIEYSRWKKLKTQRSMCRTPLHEDKHK